MSQTITPFQPIRAGTSAFWRANIALFLSAFAVFATLYSVQPLLPLFVDQFHLNAGESSLSLSVTTAMLAVCLVLASWVADRIGRKTLMVWALGITAALGLLLPLVPNWPALIGIRALMGISLSGLPAIAMVYLAEEIDPDALGFSMGLYIGGTALGGMAGRLIVGILGDLYGWRMSLFSLGAIIGVSALLVAWLLPPARNSIRVRLSFKTFTRLIKGHFTDAALPWLFAASFCLMGTFVTIYNYAGFRLALPPFSLNHTSISLIFLVYLLGTISSAFAGSLSAKHGRRIVFLVTVLLMVLGVALTLIPQTFAVIAGLAVVSIGFFAAHGIASAWVARRALVGRAQASALYLFFYYVGSSVLGTIGGYAWVALGWPGVILVCGSGIAGALIIAIRLYRLPSLGLPERATVPPPAV